MQSAIENSLLLHKLHRFVRKNSPSVLYYREFVRPLILKSRAVEGLVDESCEIHILVSAKDFLNSLWTLKSFYLCSEMRYKLCIHDDGTLSSRHADAYRKHFPDARFISQSIAKDHVKSLLARYPKLQAFRSTNVFACRIVDFPIFCESSKILQIDSDVLFFDKPEYLVSQINSSVASRCFANRDVKSAYTITIENATEKLGVQLIERFNAGLALMHRSAYSLEEVERFLSVDGVTKNLWLIEQTITALLASRFGAELLPPEYDLDIADIERESPCRHFVGVIRHRFYLDGIRKLRKKLLHAGISVREKHD